MVELMLLAGLRRCEVLGLSLTDVRPGERRVFIAEGKGGSQRIVPVASPFFASLASYLDVERPAGVLTDNKTLLLTMNPLAGTATRCRGVHSWR